MNLTSQQLHDRLVAELVGKQIKGTYEIGIEISNILRSIVKEAGENEALFTTYRDNWCVYLCYRNISFGSVKCKRHRGGLHDSWTYTNKWVYKDFDVELYYEENENMFALSDYFARTDEIIASNKEKENKEDAYDLKVLKWIMDRFSLTATDAFRVAHRIWNKFYKLQELLEKESRG